MSTFFTAKKVNTANQGKVTIDTDSTPVPVDVYRHGNKLIILAPIAGVTIEDVSVAITDDILTISGVRRHPDTVSSSDYFSHECFWGKFSRSVVLPLNVDTNKVAAFYKRGILRIEMPILDGERTRIIPVKMAENCE